MKFNLYNINLPTAFIIVFTLLLVDQASKFYIKLNFELSSFGTDAIIDWGFFKLLFVENKGMAMGAKLNDFLPFINDKTAKLGLTIFRLFSMILGSDRGGGERIRRSDISILHDDAEPEWPSRRSDQRLEEAR